MVLLLPLSFPHWESAAFFSSSIVEIPQKVDFLSLYIPSNPFYSLANNVVPAVVLFSILFGIALMGLMLFSVAGRPEILRDLRWRRLHLGANALAALIFLAQGISGPRDLLGIPLSWQKPAIQACDFQARSCPPAVPEPPAP